MSNQPKTKYSIRFWTKSDDNKLVQELEQKVPIETIATNLNRTERALHFRIAKLLFSDDIEEQHPTTDEMEVSETNDTIKNDETKMLSICSKYNLDINQAKLWKSEFDKTEQNKKEKRENREKKDISIDQNLFSMITEVIKNQGRIEKQLEILTNEIRELNEMKKN